MKTKTRRIVAIIALVFMVVFTVTLILVLFNANMGGGAVLYTAIGSGVVGIALYFVLWFDNRRKQKEEEIKKRLAEAEDASNADEGAVESAEEDGAENAPGITDSAIDRDSENDPVPISDNKTSNKKPAGHGPQSKKTKK